MTHRRDCMGCGERVERARPSAPAGRCGRGRDHDACALKHLEVLTYRVGVKAHAICDLGDGEALRRRPQGLGDAAPGGVGQRPRLLDSQARRERPRQAAGFCLLTAGQSPLALFYYTLSQMNTFAHPRQVRRQDRELYCQ